MTSGSKNSSSIFVLLFVTAAIAFYGCKGMARSAHNSNVSSNNIQRLRGKTAIFILPEKEYDYFDDYKELLPRAWTLTPLEVIKYSDLERYEENAGNYAFFTFGGLKTTSTNTQTGFSYSNTHYYFTLALPSVKPKRGKIKINEDELSRIELYPDMSTVYKFSKKDITETLYTVGGFRNFSLPYMMAYLRFMQKNLENAKNPWVYENYSDDFLRGKLRKDTLYIPDSLMFSRDKFTGRERVKSEDFFQSYEGRYKYVSKTELIDIIKGRKPTKPLFLFEYVLSSTDKYVGVLEINSGTVVYRKYSPVTYNIKPKDLKGILD